MPRIIFLLICLFSVGNAAAQRSFVPLSADYSHLVERYQIKSGRNFGSLHTQMKPYFRVDIARLADSLVLQVRQSRVRSDAFDLTKQDEFNLNYLRQDSWEESDDPFVGMTRRPILKYLYARTADMVHYQNRDFELHFNPVIYWAAGTGAGVPRGMFINTRGAEIRGSISRKLGFYSFLSETQAFMPNYFQERTSKFQAFPMEGFQKAFKGDTNKRDFPTARGYITFDALKKVNIQFGHDRMFVGNGFRSMILSDNSSPFLFLKFTTRIGRFQYTNLFAEIFNAQGANRRPYGVLPDKKFLAFHHLSFAARNNLSIGLFESVIHSRDKSQGYFDLNYLNPIIFYRAIEQQRSSADNALLGADFHWNFAKKYQLYGQLVLDEFNLGELRRDKTWWGNKYAYQIGGKAIDVFGIPHLDIQAEFNFARPYTYQHLSDRTNYVHYNQSLAHPFGANFRELLGILRYQPAPKLNLTAILLGANYGQDAPGLNFGGNPLLSYNSRPANRDNGNTVGQGIETNLFYGELVVSYQVWHNVFFDYRHVLRRERALVPSYNRDTNMSSFAIRINAPQRVLAF